MSSSDLREQELVQLREEINTLNDQCAQLNTANQAWQQFYQTQVAEFSAKLNQCFHIHSDITLDQIAQQIIDQMMVERQQMKEQVDLLKKTTNQRLDEQGTAHDEQLLTMKEQFENELNEKQVIIERMHQQLSVLKDDTTTQTTGKKT